MLNFGIIGRVRDWAEKSDTNFNISIMAGSSETSYD